MKNEVCELCKKTAISGRQTLVRWFDTKDHVAHHDCYRAVEKNGKCPQCGSESGVKIPRELGIYCEDCGWPDEDFADGGPES